MRVLHVITGLAAGGAETQLRLLLQHSRHDADVVSLYNPGVVAAGLRSDGVSVTDLDMTSNLDVTAVAALARLMRQGRYDVVHTHLYRACLYGRTAARLAGVPRIVATEHSLMNGQLEGHTAGPLVRALYRGTERLGQRTIAVSAAVREQLLAWGLAPERVVHVPNGLALDALAYSPERRAAGRELLGIPQDATVIGTLGRLHKGKRCDLLLAAAAPLLGPERMLLLVGAGPEREALEAQARDLGVADFVVFGGELPAGAVLSAMDVFASPSAAETFGLAILEALASGLPTVYRNCPALDELGAPVDTALHLADDSVETLRAGLEKALAGAGPRTCPPELAALDITAVARAIDDLYESL